MFILFYKKNNNSVLKKKSFSHNGNFIFLKFHNILILFDACLFICKRIHIE